MIKPNQTGSFSYSQYILDRLISVLNILELSFPI